MNQKTIKIHLAVILAATMNLHSLTPGGVMVLLQTDKIGRFSCFCFLVILSFFFLLGGVIKIPASNKVVNSITKILLKLCRYYRKHACIYKLIEI